MGKLNILLTLSITLKRVNRMGEMSTLTIATSGKESLRTTVPMSIIKQFKLKAGDKLDWNFEVKEGELALIVKPLRESSSI